MNELIREVHVMVAKRCDVSMREGISSYFYNFSYPAIFLTWSIPTLKHLERIGPLVITNTKI